MCHVKDSGAEGSDAERWRFLADHELTLHTAGDGYAVHLVRRGEPPEFLPVSIGPDMRRSTPRSRDSEYSLDRRTHLRGFEK